MKALFDTYRPEGFHTLNAYLFVADPQEEIDFLKNAFYADEIGRTTDEKTGEIRNCILRIGDSCFMIGQARGEFEHMRTAFYLFVADVDAVYQNALSNGAKDCLAPMEMSYEDYQGGIIDPAGNYWWISKRMVQKGYDD